MQKNVASIEVSMFYKLLLLFKLCIMNQSIPVASISSATARHLLASSFPGVGNLQILRGPGVGHLPTLGLLPSLWHARG